MIMVHTVTVHLLPRTWYLLLRGEYIHGAECHMCPTLLYLRNRSIGSAKCPYYQSQMSPRLAATIVSHGYPGVPHMSPGCFKVHGENDRLFTVY